MKAHLAKLSLALLSTVFLLGCQDMGSSPVGPEGLGPEFHARHGECEGHNKNDEGCDGGDDGGGANVMGTLGLAFGMTAVDFSVSIGHDSDKKLAFNNSSLMHEISMHFKRGDGLPYEKADCVEEGTTLDDGVFQGLVGELSGPTATKERSTIFIAIDKSTGLTVGDTAITANHLLLVERDGTFDNDSARNTGIKVGRKAHSNELTVQWISSDVTTEGSSVDVFEFTGTSVSVVASDPDGRGGGKFSRVIACDDDNSGSTNKVVVTLTRSAVPPA